MKAQYLGPSRKGNIYKVSFTTRELRTYNEAFGGLDGITILWFELNDRGALVDIHYGGDPKNKKFDKTQAIRAMVSAARSAAARYILKHL